MATTSAWRGPPPEDIPAWTIVQAGHLVGRRFWAALAQEDLTPIQFGALLALDAEPGLSNAALARRVLVTPQSASEMLTGLVGAGLVRRAAAAGPGRPVPAALTAAGRRRLRRCERVIAEVGASLGLDANEAAALNAALHRVLAS